MNIRKYVLFVLVLLSLWVGYKHLHPAGGYRIIELHGVKMQQKNIDGHWINYKILEK